MTARHEGGFVDDQRDGGGATKYGISLRWLRSLEGAGNSASNIDGDIDGDGDIDQADIHALTPQMAKDFFYQEWWQKHRLHDLPPLVAVKVFDLSINTGPRPSFRNLQRACRACRYSLAEDGILGPKTHSTVHSAHAYNKAALLGALCSEAAGYYRSLVVRNPQYKAFLKGWLNRAYYYPQIEPD